MTRRTLSTISVLAVLMLLAIGLSNGVFAASMQKSKPALKATSKSKATPLSKKQPSIRPTLGKPGLPLAIARVHIVNQVVHVTVTNTGSKLAAKEHGLVRLTVKSASGHINKKWLFSKVDPKRKLTQSRSRVKFNTGLKLKQTEIVTTELFMGTWKITKKTTLTVLKTKRRDLSRSSSSPKIEPKSKKSDAMSTIARRRADLGGDSTESPDGPPEFSPERLNLTYFGQPTWAHTPFEGGTTAGIEALLMCTGDGCHDQAYDIVGYMNDTLAFTRTATALRNTWYEVEEWFVPECGAELRLEIDPENRISETDETDNTWTTTIECSTWPDTEKPDLGFQSGTISPWPMTEGESITVNYKIRNTLRFGTVPVARANVGLKIGDSIVQQNTHRDIQPFEDHDELYSGSFTFTPDCSAGPVSIIVDPANEVDEGDETNNEHSDPYNFNCVPAALDLWMGLFDTSVGQDVEAGREITITADVYSVRGDPRDIQVRCGVVGGAVLYEDTIASMDAVPIDPVRRGERIRFDATFCPENQLHRLYCEVDPANTIVETDDSNNRIELEIRTVADERYTCP